MEQAQNLVALYNWGERTEVRGLSDEEGRAAFTFSHSIIWPFLGQDNVDALEEFQDIHNLPPYYRWQRQGALNALKMIRERREGGVELKAGLMKQNLSRDEDHGGENNALVSSDTTGSMNHVVRKVMEDTSLRHKISGYVGTDQSDLEPLKELIQAAASSLDSGGDNIGV